MTFFHLQKRSFKNANEKGQVIMIVVLVMVVVLTVGLSLASRAIVSVKNDVEEANSQKAFSAAEAGIEKALVTRSSTAYPLALGNNASFTSTFTAVAQSQILVNNGASILQDDGADIWLSTYPDYSFPTSGRLRIYWGATNISCNEAALEVAVISGTPLAPTLSRFAADPCVGRNGLAGNGFNAPVGPISTNINGHTFYYYIDVTYFNGLIARVIPLYTSEVIAVGNYANPGGFLVPLPSQGSVISSTGKSGSTQRQVIFYQGNSSLPSEFFYGLFSPK